MLKINKSILVSLAFIATQSFAQTNESLQGYWAMLPLENGIANVAYFDGKDSTTLYPFECDFKTKTVSSPEPPETSKYKVENNALHLTYPDEASNQTLQIKSFKNDQLILEQTLLESYVFTFEYKKVDGIQNLCPTQ